MMLGDSERIRLVLQESRPILSDISAVCDVSAQQCKLEETDHHVQAMQKTFLQPLDSLLQAAPVRRGHTQDLFILIFICDLAAIEI